MRILKRLWAFLKGDARQDAASIESRRGFFRAVVGAAVMLKTAPLMLLEPAKASANMLTAAGSAGARWATLDERVFFRLLIGDVVHEMLPSIPTAADGQALYSTTPWRPDFRERVL